MGAILLLHPTLPQAHRGCQTFANPPPARCPNTAHVVARRAEQHWNPPIAFAAAAGKLVGLRYSRDELQADQWGMAKEFPDGVPVGLEP